MLQTRERRVELLGASERCGSNGYRNGDDRTTLISGSDDIGCSDRDGEKGGDERTSFRRDWDEGSRHLEGIATRGRETHHSNDVAAQGVKHA
jgi:hypothetical protein